MLNPARAILRQFVLRTPTTLLAIGTTLSLIDFLAAYTAAKRDGVLRINHGIGLLDHYGFFSTIFGNAIALYAAKKYFDGVRSIRGSKAVVNAAPLERSLQELTRMIELRGKYNFLLYLLVVFGTLWWLSNLATHVLGDPVAKWGPIFDSQEHPWSFMVGRFHIIYLEAFIMPLVVYVMVCSSLELKKTMNIGYSKGVLRYDLLNPDQRGGFGFIDHSVLAFNIVAALVYVQITLYIETYAKYNLEHIIDYIILTILLIGVNKIFFADLYGMIKKLRLDSLNSVKDEVFKNNKLSFEILKYCYERRMRPLSVANVLVQAGAIAVPAVVKFWPFIKTALNRA
jgi:riboflavin transporter FmnP